MPLLIVAACDQGTPATPTFPVAETSVSICPQLDPNFDSIRSKLLDTNTCGAPRAGSCHSSEGAPNSGSLDFTVDASALYFEFLGDAGTGHKASNNSGDAGTTLYRVVPGDAGASYLYIKLITKITNDPKYGAGMPRDNPGALCPEALNAVATWINHGARFEEPDSGDDAGDASIEDADIADADTDAGD